MAQAARGLQRFDHLLERHILVHVAAQRRVLDLRQQLQHAWVRVHVHPQRQRVDEEPDQVFQLCALAIGHRRADHHVRLAAQARQQHRPACEQGHEQRRSALLRQPTQARHQPRRQSHRHHPAGVALHLRPHTIRRQLQQHRGTGQVLAPEGQLLLQHLALQPLPLPGRIVRILNRQRRQRVRLALAVRRVQARHFPHQHTQRPAIGNNVVLRHQQHVLGLRQLQQATADQRTLRQVKRRQSLFRTQRCHRRRLLLRRHPAQIVLGQRKTDRFRRDHLLRRPIHRHERRTQVLVAGHDPVQCRTQRRPIQHTLQAQRRRHVIRTARRVIELVQKPQPLLRP